MSYKDYDCKGCRIINMCDMKPELNSHKCPCVDCLVKPVCEDDCEKEKDYIQLWENEMDRRKIDREKRQLCEGCIAVCNTYFKNYPVYHNLKGEVVILCPCTNCIVKVICHDICEAFNEFETKRLELRGLNDERSYRKIDVNKNEKYPYTTLLVRKYKK